MNLRQWLTAEAGVKYPGFEKTVDSLSWLLIALVALDIAIDPIDAKDVFFLGTCAVFLRLYRALERRLGPLGQAKGLVDLMLLLFFAVASCWFSGKETSPFLPAIYLILMIASLTQGKRNAYFMALLTIASYALLAYGAPGNRPPDFSRLLQFIPFLLIAYLGTVLSGEAENARIEVERLSLTDDLTQLNNMRSFYILADHQEKIAKRNQEAYAICMLDTDNLKQLNDRHGHFAGTELIKWTGRIISQNIRESDIAARFGGDEFVIMYNGHHKEQIFLAVDRIVRAMENSPFPFEGKLLRSSLSAGIACYPCDGDDLRTVIKKADEAMYLSKRRGKNRVSLYDPEECDTPVAGSEVGGKQFGEAVAELDRHAPPVEVGKGDPS
ncbi:GGDEF domain-containing protein [Geomesophilobacter sediminis]|uniref:diguanylate cyclase n=1 Tax=Geomesophilobacter sediminis TaxID=2798584 RepID=A0A8J7LYB0_9BACT|nr:GGDEF domain-containing protein [Geomesophilobacter sediminis]MBJ6724726.1 GGDEF domain-containing protein [Geomesophilobacter sediminis]